MRSKTCRIDSQADSTGFGHPWDMRGIRAPRRSEFDALAHVIARALAVTAAAAVAGRRAASAAASHAAQCCVRFSRP